MNTTSIIDAAMAAYASYDSSGYSIINRALFQTPGDVPYVKTFCQDTDAQRSVAEFVGGQVVAVLGDPQPETCKNLYAAIKSESGFSGLWEKFFSPDTFELHDAFLEAESVAAAYEDEDGNGVYDGFMVFARAVADELCAAAVARYIADNGLRSVTGRASTALRRMSQAELEPVRRDRVISAGFVAVNGHGVICATGRTRLECEDNACAAGDVFVEVHLATEAVICTAQASGGRDFTSFGIVKVTTSQMNEIWHR